MPDPLKFYGIIPARYASTRFPGKPLAEILGLPMIVHVHRRASQCPMLAQTVLATDDERIAACAREHGLPVVMTRSDHPSGTDRVLEAAEKLGLPDSAVIANIQGDEPALEPAMLTELLAPFDDPSVRVSTLARPMDAVEAQSPDRVKVVFDETGNALYFSRAPIPFARDGVGEHYGHVGLYAYRMEALKTFASLRPGRLENLEKLEQLRLLENAIPIRVALTGHVSVGVDRPEDIETVTAILSEK